MGTAEHAQKKVEKERKREEDRKRKTEAAKVAAVTKLKALLEAEHKSKEITLSTIYGFQETEALIDKDSVKILHEEVGGDLMTFFFNENGYSIYDEKPIEITKLAENTIESVSTLPWSYHYLISLPFSNRVQAEESRPIGTMGHLIKGSSGNTSMYVGTMTTSREIFGSAIARAMAGIEDLPPLRFDENHFYLKFELKGYVRKSNETLIHQNIETLSKAFLGLGLANGLFEIDRSSRPAVNHRYIRSFMVKSHEYLEVEDADFASVDKALLGKIKVSLPQPPIPTKGMEIFKVDEEVFRKNRQDAALWQINKAFQSNDAGTRLRRAGRWYFEAEAAADSRLKVIQFATVLEILLGQKLNDRDDGSEELDSSNQVSLTTLMADRCAFALGNKDEERKLYYKKFKKVYNLRSRILHDGHEAVSRKDIIILRELEYLVRELLKSELSKA